MILGNSAVREKIALKMKENKNMLLTGKKGLGKFTYAMEVARRLLCLDNGDDNCECESCLKVQAGTHPDLKVLGTDKDICVADIGKLSMFLSLSPVLSSNRIIIFDNADRMNYSAQNKILKDLEENSMIFIFVAHNKMLPTIHSRTLVYNFRELSYLEFSEAKLFENFFERDLLYTSTGGAIGRAIELKQSDVFDDYLEGFKTVITEDNGVEVLRKLHLVKEKDSENYFTIIGEYRYSFLRALRAYFISLIIQMGGFSALIFREIGVHETKLSLQDVYQIVLRIDQLCSMNEKLVISDFYSLILFIVEKRKKDNVI